MRRLLLCAAAAGLVLAAPAAGALPVFKQGSSLGEGIPLKAYATITPTVHLFGDELTAKIHAAPGLTLGITGFGPLTKDFADQSEEVIPGLL